MTKRISRDEFLQNLSDSGLLTQEELRRALDTLSGLQATDGDTIAQELIAAGTLTSFQVEALRERRFDGLVIGNYQLLDRLGAGGMGTVYKARHRRMRRVVAIKILSHNVAESESFIKRFQREVEAVARLSHPNIVMAHDADEARVGHFLVMEFVNGRDLASEVQERGSLPVREAVASILQAARALEYAHAQGIIHRDIKPANLLRDVNGVVKVADLGLARFNQDHAQPSNELSALTQAGTIMGTVDFMSPEQAMGAADIDQRADIYSLGCTLYFLLVGKPPFEGPSMMATLVMHREAPIPSLTALHPGVPAELEAVYRRMLAKAPADRYPTMTEVVRALEGVEAKLARQVETPAVRPLPDRTPADTAVATGVWERPQTGLGDPPATPPTMAASLPGNDTVLGLKVLLVEPSRTQSGIIRKYLQSQGVEHVAAVATGVDALQAVRSDRPDAVVSALHLPDMTGVQLAKQLHGEDRAAAPGFVLISSEAQSSEVGSLSQCGRAVHLHKPFTPVQLLDALRVVAPSQPPPLSATTRSQLQVLIVDDSAAARAHVRSVLVGLGLAQFVEAEDGARAVAVAAGKRFDLIVTDYNMPYMDGLGLVGYLKQNPATAAIPIIMVTTEDDPGKLEAVRRLGVAAVCDKSFPAEVVRNIIDQVVKTP